MAAKLLDHPMRAHIYAVVQAKPGIHFRDIMRASGKAMGVVRHHLGVLVEGAALRSRSSKGHRHFYPASITDGRTMQALAVIQSPITRQLMRYILSHPGTTLAKACEATGLQYATVKANARKLRDAELVVARRGGRPLMLFPSKLGTSMPEVAQLDAGDAELQKPR